MIRNYLMLISGILSIFFAFGHSWYGYNDFIPAIAASNVDASHKMTSVWIWNLPSTTTFLCGIVLIITSLKRTPAVVGIYIGWFIISINAARFLIFSITVGIMTPNKITETIPQAIGVFFYVGIIYAGVWRNKYLSKTKKTK